MRQRITTKMWKAVRRIQKEEPTLFSVLQRHHKHRIPLTDALRQVLLDRSMQFNTMIAAARVLAIADPERPAAILMRRFFEFSEEQISNRTSGGCRYDGQTATILQSINPVSAVPHLIEALRDPNPYKREGAAYALNFARRGRQADEALIAVLTDTSQPPDVRGQAAESLGGTRRAIPALLSVLSDPAVEVRFWAVWALGGQRNREPHREIVAALERMLSDVAVYPGWWSVAREALAMLCRLDPPGTTYSSQLETETQRVINDPNASDEDRRWAEFWNGVSFPALPLARYKYQSGVLGKVPLHFWQEILEDTEVRRLPRELKKALKRHVIDRLRAMPRSPGEEEEQEVKRELIRVVKMFRTDPGATAVQ